jgi:peptide chain release factor
MVLHRPTGLRVRAEGERSQHQNRSTALARLAALLAERAEAATAHATAERRLAHDRLERGAPVAVWAPGRTGLVRVDGEGPPPRP